MKNIVPLKKGTPFSWLLFFPSVRPRISLFSPAPNALFVPLRCPSLSYLSLFLSFLFRRPLFEHFENKEYILSEAKNDKSRMASLPPRRSVDSRVLPILCIPLLLFLHAILHPSRSLFLPFFLYLSKVKNDPDAANYVKYLIRRISVIGIMADRYGIELPLYMAHSSCV